MSKGTSLGGSYPKNYNSRRLAGLGKGLEELCNAGEEVEKRKGEEKVGRIEQRGEKWRRGEKENSSRARMLASAKLDHRQPKNSGM